MAASTAQNDVKNRKIEVKREDLLEALKQNLTKHRAEYASAMRGYKVAFAQKLDEAAAVWPKIFKKQLAEARKQLDEFDIEDPDQLDSRLARHILCQSAKLTVPRDYSREYEAAIDMVSLDVRDVIELTHAEFQCFVRDQWDWKDDFSVTSKLYNS